MNQCATVTQEASTQLRLAWDSNEFTSMQVWGFGLVMLEGFTTPVLKLLLAATIGTMGLAVFWNRMAARSTPSDAESGMPHHEDSIVYLGLVIILRLMVIGAFVGYWAIKVYPRLPEPLKCWPFC